MKKIKPLPPVAKRRPTRIELPLEVRHIPHNTAVLEALVKPDWYMTAGSTDMEFVFLGGRERDGRTTRTSADGWTEADAWSFHDYLMGWETVDRARLDEIE